MNVKCIVLDDDPACAALAATFVKEHSALDLHAFFTEPGDAAAYLEQHKIDLLFADMEMPGITGIDFVRSLKHAPNVIFITSHRDYAVESFSLHAIDYLLKPLKYDRFKEAADHAVQYIKSKLNGSRATDIHINEDHFFIRSDAQYVKLKFEDVIFVEAMKDFVRIYTPGKKYLVLTSLKNIEETLPKHIFLRTHRSYLLNRNHIQAINNHDIETAGGNVPLGASYKDDVLESVLGNRLIKR